jgi:phage/plasmid-associated DNA primase
MAMEVVPSDFLKYRDTWLGKYILPTIPVEIDLSKSSKIQPGNLGKIPGIYKDDGTWIGFPNWPIHYQKARNSFLVRWQGWQMPGLEVVVVPVFLSTVEIIAFDIDAQSVEVAQWMRATIERILGVTLVVRRRDGNETRMVLFFKHKDHTQPITKGHLKVADGEGVNHALDILGKGHGVVIEGPHKLGAMQYWESVGLLEGLEDLPEIDIHMCDAAENALKAEAPGQGLTVVKGSIHTGSNSASAYKIDDIMSPHIEENRARLTRAIQHIDLDDPRIEYNEFVDIQRAICAAVSGDRDYMAEVVWPWACTQSIRKGQGPLTRDQPGGIAWLEERWASFHDSQIGADTVYGWAARCGYYDAGNEAAAEKGDGVFDPLPDDDDGPTVLGGAAGGGSGGVGGAGSNGPLPEPDTHSKITDDLVPLLRPEWRYHVQEQVWYRHYDGRWHPNEPIIEAINKYADQLAAQIRATVNGPNGTSRARGLQSYGTWNSVKRALESRTAMRVSESQFDADPELLNTPRGVINLRTGACTEHDPELLMRHMTRVSPALELWYADGFAPVDYRTRMPWFWRAVDNVSMNPQGTSYAPGEHREWVADAIQLAFADATIGHQAILFVQGLPGVGKTQIFEALFKILGSYAKRLKPAYIAKTADGKRFDDHDLAGKRFYFCDETQQGSSFDETLLCTLSGTDEITSDVKFGRPVSFVNRGNLVIVGNHRPHFISHEAGGLSSRMLLLEAGGIDYREPTNDGTDDLAEVIVRQEGEVLLLWAIEAAMRELQGTSGWREKIDPMRAAAKAYTRENSPVVRWVEDRQMVLGAEAEISTTQAHEMFKHYGREAQIKTAERSTLGDFRQALKAAFPDLLIKKGSLKRHGGLSYVFGLGAPGEGAFGPGSNVTALISSSGVKE